MVAGALISVVSVLEALTTTVSSRLIVSSSCLAGEGEGLGLGSCAAAADAHKRPRPTAGINPFIPSSFLLGCDVSTPSLTSRPRDERHPLTVRRKSQRE